MSISPGQLKQILAPHLKPYWSRTRPTYAGFLDTSYDLLPVDVWRDMMAAAPSVPADAYIPNIFDCDDFAYEFKIFSAKRQMTHYAFASNPFAIGMAVGYFGWVGNGRTLHAANFAVIGDAGVTRIEWYDLRAQQSYPFSQIRDGLEWVLV